MIAAPTPEVLPACACGRKGKNARLPQGWKRHQEIVYCDKCWRTKYVLRAISMPVASPGQDLTWTDLRNELKELWRETTRCHNWMMTEMYARDIRRKDQEKLPPMPKLYLYPEVRVEFPSLPPQTVSSIEQSVQRKYRAKRYDVLWTRSASLPTYRYPTPFPIHNQSWHAMLIDGKPFVSIRLKERREVRLKTGPQFWRQMKAFQQMARGEAITGECAIYPQGKALMCKMVAWLPRQDRVKDPTGTLIVRTAPDAMLVALNSKDEKLWRYHGDHLPRWSAEHSNRLQHWSDDSKFENRPTPTFAKRREAASEKFHDRMSSAAHEIAAQLAGYANRRKFQAVEYNDTEQSFCQSFPWARLRSLVAEKLDAYGIELTVAAAKEEQKPDEPAEE